MVQFAEAFSDPEIVATLSRQLGWSHFREILPIEDSLKRDFYAEMSRLDFLLTWNCTHIANATTRSKIEWVCRTASFEPPVICTPVELVEEEAP